MKSTNKKNSKKIVIGALSICLVAAMAIGGTMAFLTDSEEVTNHFSVGDLDITITEPKWDDDGDDNGTPDDPSDDTPGDGEDLVPGDTREKDPTITAVEGDSYMRVIMSVQNRDGTAIKDKDRLNKILATIRYADPALSEDNSYKLADIATYKTVNNKFTLDGGKSSSDTNATGVYYYNYNEIFKQGDKVKLFTNVIIPADWEREDLEVLGEYQIVIQAQAIQKESFADADEAFAALDAEIAAGTIDKDYATVGGVKVTP